MYFSFKKYFIRQQEILADIDNAIGIIKNASEIQKFFIFQTTFSSLKFVSMLYNLASASINESHINPESSIILAKDFSFSQL